MNTNCALPASQEVYRARLDRNSHKVGLPVPVSGKATFSISGQWRVLEEEGPDPTVVILRCRARIAKRSSEHRLTDDATFRLPEGTEFAELQVLDPSDHTDLNVTIAALPPSPSADVRPKGWRVVPSEGKADGPRKAA